MEKTTAIYVRRSVFDKDNKSLSISSQKEDCIKYVTEHYGEDTKYQIYCDEDKSGKDIDHRPDFARLISDVREGLIDRVVIKRIDRFSRNLIDGLTTMKEFEEIGIGVVSATELLDTSTLPGKMMRNMLLMFAEQERETIALRVKDAYKTRSRETGFYQGGKLYYGYVPERREVNGKKGSVLIPSAQAFSVIKAYELYQDRNTSLQAIIKYFVDNNIDTKAKNNKKVTNLTREHLSRILKSPLYVKADENVYHYLASRGYTMLDEITAYDGTHGLFEHSDGNGGYFIKVGYHEGLIEPSVWLNVQDRKSHNKKIPNRIGAMYTWLGGLVKCAHCGYALSIQYGKNKGYEKTWLSYRDRGAYTVNGCLKKTLKIRPAEVEAAVFKAMQERLKTLEIVKNTADKIPADIAELVSRTGKIEAEIEALMEKAAFADGTTFERINSRINRLDKEKLECEQKFHDYQRRHRSIDTMPLAEPLARWDELSVEEKNAVAAKIIKVVKVSDETGIEIIFSI